MSQLLDTFGYLSVILRGFTLAFQSLVIGGISFLLFVIVPRSLEAGSELGSFMRPCRRMIAVSAVALAVTQMALVSMDSSVLMATADMRLEEVAGATFFTAGSVIVILALAIALLSRSDSHRVRPVLLVLSVLVLGASVTTSHATARVDNRFGVAIITALHQLGAATWIGGIPYLVVTLRRSNRAQSALVLGRRFSRVAFTSVCLLLTAGVMLSILYIGSIPAIYGTAYGVMTGSKVALFAMLLVLGALNFFIVRRARTDSGPLLNQLRRFTEVEIGIGFTVIFAAASLTSQPPAVDMTFARVSAAEIGERMKPQWPRLRSPNSDDLSVPTLQVRREALAAGLAPPPSFVPGAASATHPNTPADMAWSEYNHHWAGLIVLLIGLLALIARSGRAGWARHWPLSFILLAIFLFFRADPESWPLGANGFWESFADSEVLQHRIFVVLIIAFAVFEWRVRTGRKTAKYAAYVFPLVCAMGGALLLAHSHSLGNVKEELLAELSHVPLALMGVLAGWSRWLELRLPRSESRIPSIIWPVCFILIGALLLNYRES